MKSSLEEDSAEDDTNRNVKRTGSSISYSDDDSQRSILQLREVLIHCPSLPVGSAGHRSCDGSLSPTSTICSTPPNGEEESHLSMSTTMDDSQASVSSFPAVLSPLRSDEVCNLEQHEGTSDRDFILLRITYLLVTLVIMLADGLQGEF